jgi:tetratricopeptide (TPR) repeat protein
MKRWILAAWLLWGTGVAAALAQTLDEQYVRIYNLIQQADAQKDAGQPTEALARYAEAQSALKRIQQAYPDWNARLIGYRLDYIADKITGLTAPVTSGPAGAEKPAGPAAATSASAAADQAVTDLRDQVRRLQADKILLEAKLKEALAAQPAAVDPRELAKAETRITELSKENDLLQASLAAEKTRAAGGDPKQLDTARAELAEANRKLAEQIQLAQSLATDNATLQAQVRTVTSAAQANEALRAENELLKQQLTQLQAAKPSRRQAETAQKLTEAEARYATLKSDLEILQLEKVALQNQIRSMTNTLARAVTVRQEDVKRIERLEAERAEMQRKLAVAPAPVVVPTNRPEDIARIKQLEQETAALRSQIAAAPAPAPAPTLASARPEDLQRIKLLEAERDQLRRDLEAANQKLAGRESRAAARKLEQLNTEIDTLRARVQVFEARAVPYSAEELALFKAPTTAPAPREPSPAKVVSSRELPAGGAALAAEARRAFGKRDFAKAEASYQQILKLDATNAYTLANLAAIQMEQGKFADAEQNLRAAVTAAPQDAYSQSLLGILYFRRERYDDALDALSKAAKLDPNNAEVQNYLGMVLSERGLRGPAETALRKAIELEPNNGSAHNNLAVIYLSQNPPLVELARWHYQKALAAKHPRNPDLEKMLDEKSKAK